MQEQVATIFQIAEIDSQRSAVDNRRPDWFFFVCPVGQPHMSHASQSHAAVEFIHRCEFDVLLQFFCCDVDTAARRRRYLQEGLLMR